MNQRRFNLDDAQAFFALSDDLLCVGSADGRLLTCNPVWTTTLGYGLDELIDHRIEEFLHPDDVEECRSRLGRLERGGTADLTNRVRHRDGGWRWLAWRLIADSDGVVRALARDVTDRATLKRDLDASEQLILRTQMASETGHFTYDVRTRRLEASDTLRLLLEAPDAGDGIEEWLDLIDSDDVGRLRGVTSESATTLDEVLRVRGASSHGYRWLRCVADLVRDEQGAVVSITGVVKDVTRSRVAQQRLESDIRLDAAVRELATSDFTSFGGLLDRALSFAVDHTQSQYGYILHYDEDTEVFISHAWSAEVMEVCSVPGQPVRFELSKTGIWGEVVRQRNAMIVNDFDAPNPLKRGLPEGHAPIRSWMSVPIFIGGRIVGVGGCANGTEPYTDDDVRQLSRMMHTVWALAERFRARDELVSLASMLTESQRLGRVGSFRRDVRTGHVEISEVACEIFGKGWRPDSDPPIEDVVTCFHPHDRDRVSATIKEAWGSGGVRDFDARIQHPDGAIIQAHVRLETILDVDGEPQWILGNVADVTELHDAEQRLIEYQDRLRGLASELARVSEHERRCLSLELHDRVSQPLATAKLRLQLVRADCERSRECDDVQVVMELLDQSLNESRKLLTELSPPHVYEIGLRAAFDWLRDQMHRSGLEVSVTYDGDIPELDEEVRTFVFRTAREFLTNVLKHAKTDTARLTLACEGGHVVLTVEDDGGGFDVEGLSSLPAGDHGFGLFSLREYSAGMGAAVEIESEPGKGTRARLVLEVPGLCATG